MTEKTSNKNGARGHPLNPDKEKILISQEAKTERKARQKANLPDTAFRQAEKADRFAVREDVFSAEADAEKKTTSKLLKARRSRIKKSYAKDVRHELGQENPADQRGGIRTKATGKSQSTAPKGHFYSEENLKKDGAFFVGEKRSKGRKAIRRFSRQKISSAAENAVISQKDDMFYGSDDDYNVSAEIAKKAKAAQKRLIRKSYQTAEESAVYIPIVSRIRERAKARSGQATANGGKTALKKLAEFFEEHPVFLIAMLIISLLVMLVGSSITGSSMLITHTVAPSALATSYTAEDDDIKGAEEDYRTLEAGLSSNIDNLQSKYPGYSSYELSAGQIGHDPYKLAALLTVLHEDYTRRGVQADLKKIFEMQYNLSMHDEAGNVEKKKVQVGQSLGQVVTSGYCNCSICCGQWAGGATASGAKPRANHTIAVDASNPIVPMGTKIVMNGVEYTVEDTGGFGKYGVAFDVYYDSHDAALTHGHKTWEAYIADDNGTKEVEVMVASGSQQFSAVLKNNGLDYVAEQLLTKDEMDRYNLLVEMKGNKPELFEDDIYANSGAGWFDYTVAGDALSDQKFANMLAEAKKYLGYPYVWGGSSPSTSFDCSGFVCWVINHSGNGWNVGRTTANGLCNMLPKVKKSEAKPGDIIFFQGTYPTAGASHVGIYLGNGMMIHCGTPIQYASINTSYWQQHFYCFGRLPSK